MCLYRPYHVECKHAECSIVSNIKQNNKYLFNNSLKSQKKSPQKMIQTQRTIIQSSIDGREMENLMKNSIQKGEAEYGNQNKNRQEEQNSSSNNNNIKKMSSLAQFILNDTKDILVLQQKMRTILADFLSQLRYHKYLFQQEAKLKQELTNDISLLLNFISNLHPNFTCEQIFQIDVSTQLLINPSFLLNNHIRYQNLLNYYRMYQHLLLQFSVFQKLQGNIKKQYYCFFQKQIQSPKSFYNQQMQQRNIKDNMFYPIKIIISQVNYFENNKMSKQNYQNTNQRNQDDQIDK